MSARSRTNTSLSTARRCLHEYELAYNQRLELDREDEREVLQVGQTWHRAFDVQNTGGDPYQAIAKHAPSSRWIVKLSRLFAAYGWYWSGQPIALTSTEETFAFEYLRWIFEGQIDGRLVTPDGRRGIVERKTTSETIDGDADYWRKLALDVQVGLYGLAADRPDFILYDVVRKPTIAPKSLPEKDTKRIRAELNKTGSATYFGETFTAEQLAEPLALSEEGLELYGARLTADIGNRPAYYFQRRLVPRTDGDYRGLLEDIRAWSELIDACEASGYWPRNPDACNAFGQCRFFGLCSNNTTPKRDETPPPGFRRREHLHPELVRDAATDTSKEQQ